MTLRITYISTVIFGILVWGALAALVYFLPPETLTIGVFMLLLVVAVAATTVPVWGQIQARLTPKITPRDLRIAAFRQGLWAGLFTASVVSLRLLHLLDWILVLVLLILFTMLETFIQQRSSWKALQGTTKAGAGSDVPKTGSERGSKSNVRKD